MAVVSREQQEIILFIMQLANPKLFLDVFAEFRPQLSQSSFLSVPLSASTSILSSTCTSAWNVDTKRLFNNGYHRKTEKIGGTPPPGPLRPSRTAHECTRPVNLKFFLILLPNLRLGLTGVFSFGLPD
jgi:hypothetical protein